MSIPPRSGHPNRLSAQTSPYLLQHRLNPVDWFPWGPEAFAEARRRDVPIFLSIGYSTCYWCHVMERESFESEAVAAQMNAGFVCIKVDREERPDVDDIYMAAVQAFTPGGRGGWPMSVFLEPNTLKPFWAGTYFPDKPKFQGIPSFPQVLGSIATAWRETRAEVLEQADHLADAVGERIAGAPEIARISEAQVTQAVSQLLRLHDSIHGGFGPAPKFPQPAFLDLLLTVRRVAGDDDTARAIDSAVHTTLTAMARGGIFDQVGGGFHRYSVDDQWLVPHFEKMLYDNGALAETYARATTLPAPGTVVPDTLYARTARRICTYILREMTSPEGAFFSAQDAEVNHREGQNYLWTSDQIRALLQPADADWIIGAYGLSGGPNFRDPHHPADPATSVLFLSPRTHGLRSIGLGTDDANLARLDAINTRLYEARTLRDQPSRDDKIITGWNGLMIAGLAVTGAVLREASFVHAASRAADFLLETMRASDGGLFRCFAGGTPAIDAFLEDYALLAHGLIEVHLAGGDAKYLQAARDLCAQAESRFGDGRGGFYDTLADRPDLFVRARSLHDGAMPSGSSVMANNFIDLAVLNGKAEYRTKAAKLLAALSGAIAAHPLGAANATRALLRMLALDRRALEAALQGAPAAAILHTSESSDNPVEILSAVESVEVAPDQPVGIVLRVRIADGYHLSAADPGEGVVGLTPFKVHIVSGTGVAAFADYPRGETLGDAGDSHLVYRGEFDLPIVLERTGVWQGTPLLAVTYQPCTDRACLAATTVELQLSIEKT